MAKLAQDFLVDFPRFKQIQINDL